MLIVLIAIGRSFLSPDAMGYLSRASTKEMMAHLACFAAALAVYWTVLAILTDSMFSAVIVSYVYCRVWVESMRDLLTVVLVAIEQRACALDGYADMVKVVLSMRSMTFEQSQDAMDRVMGRGGEDSGADATNSEQADGNGSSTGRTRRANSVAGMGM